MYHFENLIWKNNKNTLYFSFIKFYVMVIANIYWALTMRQALC